MKRQSFRLRLMYFGLCLAFLLLPAQVVLGQDAPDQGDVEPASAAWLAEFSEGSTAPGADNAALEVVGDTTEPADFARTGATGVGPEEATEPVPAADLAQFGAESAAPGPHAGEETAVEDPNDLPPMLYLPLISGGSENTGATVTASAADESAGVDAGASHVVEGDFNGDGRDDLVIGVPYENLGAIADAGLVHVIYGSGAGLNAAAPVANQVWTQDSPGILGVAGASDLFGWALTVGDFNRDGRDDLAIGVPYEDLPAKANAGAVNIIFGSAVGLVAAGNQVWTQDSLGILDASEPGDLFGYALASGDFNGGGFDDLAIGVPYEDFGFVDAGAVNVLYGGGGGLAALANQFWNQNTLGILDVSEVSDLFGRSLAVGDFNNNGRDDLAIGAPYEDLGVLPVRLNAGAVNVVYGTAAGLNAAANQFWHQDSGGILGAIAANDYFGWALAAADFNNSGHDDLAVGVPYEDVSALKTDAGAVAVLYGGGAGGVGLAAAGNQLWHQDSAGIVGLAEASDYFGVSLATGDFNGGGPDDLVVGVPYEDWNVEDVVTPNIGAINVLYGGAAGLSAAGNQAWTQDSPGILDVSEPSDLFGFSMTAGDYNNNGRDDLTIGVPYENVGAIADAGAVNVIYGVAGGLNTAGNQFWHQNSAGILDFAEVSDRFGYSAR